MPYLKAMIQVTDQITLHEDEIKLEFVRASGPGGQNVNKVASAVQLRFDVRNSRSLSNPVKTRLSRLAGSRMTREGVLIIDARRSRSQEANRQDAVERLVKLIRRAAKPPKPRKRTKPTKASIERRLKAKKARSEKKRRRGGAGPDD